MGQLIVGLSKKVFHQKSFQQKVSYLMCAWALLSVGSADAATLQSIVFDNGMFQLKADSALPLPRWNSWHSDVGTEHTEMVVIDIPGLDNSPQAEAMIAGILKQNPDVKRIMIRQTATGSMRVFLELAKGADRTYTFTMRQSPDAQSILLLTRASAPAVAKVNPANPALKKPQPKIQQNINQPIVQKQVAVAPIKSTITNTQKADPKPVVAKKTEGIIHLPELMTPPVARGVVTNAQTNTPKAAVATVKETLTMAPTAIDPAEKRKEEIRKALQALKVLDERVGSLEKQLKEKSLQLAEKTKALDTLQALQTQSMQKEQELTRQVAAANQEASKARESNAALQHDLVQLRAQLALRDNTPAVSAVAIADTPVIQATAPTSLTQAEVFKNVEVAASKKQAGLPPLSEGAAMMSLQSLPATETIIDPRTPAERIAAPVTKPAGDDNSPKASVPKTSARMPDFRNKFKNWLKPEIKPMTAMQPATEIKVNRSGNEVETTPLGGASQSVSPSIQAQLDKLMPPKGKNDNRNYQVAFMNKDKPSPLPQERFSRVKEDLKKVIASQPNQQAAYWELQQLYLNEGNYKQAIEVLNNLLLVDPSNQKAYLSLVELYLSHAQPLEAHVTLESYKKINPGDTVLINTLQEKVNAALVNAVGAP